MTIMFKILAVIGLFLSSSQPILASETAANFNLIEFQPGIYVHQGVHVNFEHEQRDDIANIGFIVGDECIAVIDTGGSIKIGTQLRNAIRQISDKSVCYVINTHVHFDHVLGNFAFINSGAKFVGHHRLKESMISSTEFFMDEYAKELRTKKSLPNRSDVVVLPDVLVKDNLSLDLGNREIIIQAYPTAHSRNDISILDKKTNTLWLSDLLFVDRIPAIEGELRGWLNVLSRIQSSEPSYVIPGHGKLDLSVEAAMSLQNNYLNQVLNETREMIKTGAFMEDVIEQVGKESQTEWLLHEQHHKRNVSNAFVELEWE